MTEHRQPWTARRIGMTAAQLLVVAIVAYYVFVTISSLLRGEALGALRLDWRYLAGSVLLLGVYYVMYAHSMSMILRYLGDRMNLRDSFELNYVSGLGKYVPGGVWHVVGRFAMAPSMGVPRSHIVVTTVFENALGIVSGILVAAVSLGVSAADTIGVPTWIPIAIAATGLVLMHPEIFGRLTRLGLRLMKREGEVPALTYPQILGQVLYRALAWVVAGAAFMLYRNGIVTDPVSTLGLYAGAYAAASIAGLLVLFAPGGIGVREAVLTALLTPAYGPAIAGTIGLSSRLWSTLVELAMSGIALVLSARRKRRDAE
jgi:uncharacterized membrane protein YbhN (UPF0104 family)